MSLTKARRTCIKAFDPFLNMRMVRSHPLLFAMKYSQIITAACLTLPLVSCLSNPYELAQVTTGYAFARPQIKMTVTDSVSVGQWDVPAGLDGPRRIVIDTELQQAHYYIAGRRVGWSTISSGKAGKECIWAIPVISFIISRIM